MVKIPSLEDMLGDKLTAFAPHTSGIPFFKNGKPFSMEIMKQLFDVSSIIDRINNLDIVSSTFHKLVPLLSPQGKNDRLRYRSAKWTVILRSFPVSLDFTYFTHCKETLQFFLFKKCVT